MSKRPKDPHETYPDLPIYADTVVELGFDPATLQWPAPRYARRST